MNRIQLRACSATLAFALLGGCAFSPQARHDKYLARGKALLEKHDYSRAILEFRNAAKAMPKDAEAYYQIGLASEESGDVRTAVAFYRKALLENPKHAGAQLKIAQLMALTLDKNMVEEAESRLAALKQGSPASPELLNSLAFAQLKLGKTADAVENLDEILAHAPRELSASILLAQTKLRMGDAKGAEEALKQAAAAAPKSADPRVALGNFYIATKRPGDAQAEFERALALDSNSGPARMDLANLQRSLGQKQQAEQNFKRLAGSGSERYRPVYAEYLFGEGRRGEAVQEFERIAKANPNNRRARTQLVAAYQAVNRSSDAKEVLDQALKSNPKDLDALLQRAELFMAAGKYVQAQTDLNQVLILRPNSADAHYTLARLYAARGENLSYRQQLTQALQLNPYLDRIRVELAQSLIRDKQASAALDTLDAAPASQKQSVDIIAQRNWALWTTGDLAQMRKGIDAGLAKERSPDLLIQDGLWKIKQGRPADARVSLEEALKMDPSDLRAFSALGQSYLAQKQPARAVEAIAEYAARQPKSAPVQEFLGTTLMLQGDRAKARDAFMAAKAADPQFLNADFSLAQIDLLEGKTADARNRIQAVLSAHPGNKNAALWLGNLDASEGNRDAAIEQFKRVVESDPNNALALNNLAYLIAVYRNQPDTALKYAQEAVELSPDNPNFLDTLGWIFYQKGLYPSAVQYLERAVSDQGSIVSQYHLAMAYAKAGNTVRGRTTLDAALKVNPNVPEARAAQELLGYAQ